MNPSCFFTRGDFTLEYTIYGKGKQQLLYFHGYGKTADEFGDYHMALEDIYTIYSFSFFHHGKSVYPTHRVDRNTLTPAELNDLLAAFLEEKHINRFSLMGYSMGGKICLSLLESLGHRVNKLILVAPDGIKKNFWYRFTSRNRMGRAIYKRIIYRPRFFFFFLRTLKFTRLLDQRLYDFVRLHLETREKREQVYRVWMTLRHIDPNAGQLSHVIRQQEIRTCLNYGRYDRVCTLGQGQKFHDRLGPFSRLYILEKGHKMANAHTGEGIEAFLKEP